MRFDPSRLIQLRTARGISKAAAARLINVSAMAYGRYESGEREPSFQTVTFIAQVFGTSADYLYGETDDVAADSITISSKEEPELFRLIHRCKEDPAALQRLLSYFDKLT